MELQNIEALTAVRRRTVLVVGCNERNERFLSTILTQFDYEVRAVKTAREALEIAAAILPVLIIAAQQPDAENDAPALIRAFKSANPTATPPILVLAVKSDSAFERDCLKAGALACLNAPVTFENFYRVIQVAIEPIPRMTIRISTDLPAALNGASNNECAREISEDGAYILTSALHPLNTKMSVRIKLPDRVISADAVVIYLNQHDEDRYGRLGMGLRFLQISEEDRKRIRLFIRGEMAKGINPLRPAQ